MAVYDANYIDELQDTTPAGSDPKSQGDDAIREIKVALLGNFPSLGNTAYTGTAAQLNDLAAGNTLPFNAVIMWSGLEANKPDGWTICDGRARPGGGNSPDLKGRFIVGAQSDTGGSFVLPKVGDTGGSNETILPIQDVEGTALEVAQLPPLTGHLSVALTKDDNNNLSAENRVPGGAESASSFGNSVEIITSTGLNNATHTHPISIDTGQDGTVITNSNMPAYYALLYLIKD